MQPTTSAHRAVAPKPNSQSNPPPASGRNQTIDDYSAWATTAAGNFGNTAQSAENIVMQIVIDLVWDPVFGLSNQIVGYVADSWVNPVTGDRIIFNAAPGASHLAVSILALAMVGIMMLALAGPIYANWKSWRLSRARGDLAPLSAHLVQLSPLKILDRGYAIVERDSKINLCFFLRKFYG